MHKHEVLLIKYIGAIVGLLCLVFGIVAVALAVPLLELQLYILTIVCAAIPFGLGVAIVSRHIFTTRGRSKSAIPSSLLHYYAISTAALLALVIISIVASLLWHIPLPLQPTQIITSAIILLPIGLLFSSASQPIVTADFIKKHAIVTVLLHGTLIACLTLASYYLFFRRNYLMPELSSPNSVEHIQAMSIAITSFVLCITVYAASSIKRGGLRLRATGIWISGATVLFCLLNVLYNPWVASLSHTAALTGVDLGYSVLIATIYSLIIAFYQHNKKHSHKAVLALHRNYRLKP
jgi:hypothetical protein